MWIAKSMLLQHRVMRIDLTGSIKITINGQHQTTAVEIDKGLLNDKGMLEDLIMMAINDASSQVNRISEEKMKGVTGGLNLPF